MIHMKTDLEKVESCVTSTGIETDRVLIGAEAYKDVAEATNLTQNTNSQANDVAEISTNDTESNTVHIVRTSSEQIKSASYGDLPFFKGYLYTLNAFNMVAKECVLNGSEDGSKQLFLEIAFELDNKSFTGYLPFDIALDVDGNFITYEDLYILAISEKANKKYTLSNFLTMTGLENLNGDTRNEIWSVFDELALQIKSRSAELEKTKAIVAEIDKVSRENYLSEHSYCGIPIEDPYFAIGGTLHFKETKTVGKGDDAQVIVTNHHIGNLCTITEIAVNDDDHTDCKLVFETEFGQREMWVTKGDLLSTNGLRNISSMGCAFNENNFKEIKTYFADILFNHVDKMKRSYMTKQNGWKHGFKTFVHGNTTITKETHAGKPIYYNYADKKLAACFEASGTLEDWVRGFKVIQDDPVVHFKCYCVAGSPLVEMTGIENVSFPHIADPSEGKSFSMEGAASLDGNPNPKEVASLSLSGEFTPSSIEEYLYSRNCGCMCINELSVQAKSKMTLGEVMTKVVYMHNSGKGKSRNDRGHRNLKEKTWSGILMMNGEQPFTQETDNTGQLLRSIEIKKGMIQDSERVILFTEIIKLGRNYGHIKPLYIKYVMELGEEQVRKDFNEMHKLFITGESKSRDRIAKFLAIIALGGMYLNHIFEELGIQTFDPVELVKDLTINYIEENPDESISVKAAREYIDFIHENRLLFNKPEKQQQNYIDGNGSWATEWIDSKKGYPGYYRNGYIDHFCGSFKFIITKKLNYNYKKTKADWLAAGILEPSSNRTYDFVKDGENYFHINEEKLHLYAGFGAESKNKAMVYKTAKEYVDIYNSRHPEHLHLDYSAEWRAHLKYNKEHPLAPLADFVAYLERFYGTL